MEQIFRSNEARIYIGAPYKVIIESNTGNSLNAAGTARLTANVYNTKTGEYEPQNDFSFVWSRKEEGFSSVQGNTLAVTVDDIVGASSTFTCEASIRQFKFSESIMLMLKDEPIKIITSENTFPTSSRGYVTAPITFPLDSQLAGVAGTVTYTLAETDKISISGNNVNIERGYGLREFNVTAHVTSDGQEYTDTKKIVGLPIAPVAVYNFGLIYTSDNSVSELPIDDPANPFTVPNEGPLMDGDFLTQSYATSEPSEYITMIMTYKPALGWINIDGLDSETEKARIALASLPSALSSQGTIQSGSYMQLFVKNLVANSISTNFLNSRNITLLEGGVIQTDGYDQNTSEKGFRFTSSGEINATTGTFKDINIVGNSTINGEFTNPNFKTVKKTDDATITISQEEGQGQYIDPTEYEELLTAYFEDVHTSPNTYEGVGLEDILLMGKTFNFAKVYPSIHVRGMRWIGTEMLSSNFLALTGFGTSIQTTRPSECYLFPNVSSSDLCISKASENSATYGLTIHDRFQRVTPIRYGSISDYKSSFNSDLTKFHGHITAKIDEYTTLDEDFPDSETEAWYVKYVDSEKAIHVYDKDLVEKMKLGRYVSCNINITIIANEAGIEVKNIIPMNNDMSDIGSTQKKFKNIYATTFHGNVNSPNTINIYKVWGAVAN